MGQSDYAAANAFLDGFAAYRWHLVETGQRTGRTLAINWPLWADGGMKIDEEELMRLERQTGLQPMTTAEGLHAFDTLWRFTDPQVLVVAGVVGQIKERLFAEQQVGSSATVSAMRPVFQQNKPTFTAVQEGDISDDEQLLKCLQSELRQILAELLKVKLQDVVLDKPMSDYGFESISLTKFANRLNGLYGFALTPTLFFEYHTLAALGTYLLETYRDSLRQFYQPAKEPIKQPENAASASVQPAESRRRKSRFVKPSQSTDASQSHAAPQLTMQPIGQHSVRETKTISHEPIAIIGISGRLPGSPDLETFWQHLEQGADLITEIPQSRWDWRDGLKDR